MSPTDRRIRAQMPPIDPEAPNDSGLDAIDATGVITGNADIVCERGTAEPSNDYTLPIYPAPHDMAGISP